mmetsp:Transcript_58669/g.139793  ORF Transcript_58669/g.139793 Transcript_58669/m.139793 type:complete len:239 (-) Transcript_58669:74-790(-)
MHEQCPRSNGLGGLPEVRRIQLLWQLPLRMFSIGVAVRSLRSSTLYHGGHRTHSAQSPMRSRVRAMANNVASNDGPAVGDLTAQSRNFRRPARTAVKPLRLVVAAGVVVVVGVSLSVAAAHAWHTAHARMVLRSSCSSCTPGFPAHCHCCPLGGSLWYCYGRRDTSWRFRLVERIWSNGGHLRRRRVPADRVATEAGGFLAQSIGLSRAPFARMPEVRQRSRHVQVRVVAASKAIGVG